MNAHTHVPAPLRRLSEIVAEYEEKHEAASDQSTNSMNAARPSHNTSGHIGVSFEKRRKRWEAHIGVPGTGRKKRLGYFDEIEEAVAARKAAERQFGYHKNHGREMRA